MEVCIKSFLTLSDLSVTQIDSLLDQAKIYSLQPKKYYNHLNNKLLALTFFEASTRTKLSFDVAAKKLGLKILDFSPEESSLIKGESVADTLRTIVALGADAIVIRHSEDNLCFDLAKKIPTSLINAGAGKRDHPSQTLLDLLTIKEEFGHFKGLKVGILGDVLHSRVAHSFIDVARRLGIEIVATGPKEFIPKSVNYLPVTELIPQVDVIMCLRYQVERMDKKLDLSTFHHDFGLTEKRAMLLQKHAIIMHPAPINRGIEIASSLVECDQSRIFRQMELGVFARMSILDYIMGVNS